MSNPRENSQQDRRVYVGNLSYDVKWHHLKDFMREGMYSSTSLHSVYADIVAAGNVLFADVLLLPNGMSKVRPHQICAILKVRVLTWLFAPYRVAGKRYVNISKSSADKMKYRRI